MKKVIALSLVFVLVIFSPSVAFASAPEPEDPYPYPGCQAGASALFGPAPLTVQFWATSPDEMVAFNWGFGDGMGETGQKVSHTFVAEGVYRVRAFVTSPRGFYNTCPMLIIEVGPSEEKNTLVTTPKIPVPQPTVTPPVVQAASCSEISSEENSGPVIIICGDNNQITINPPAPSSPTVVEQPAPLSFWEKIALPFKEFFRGVIEVVEGWFNLQAAP